MMGDLSDLELVARAMEPTTQPRPTEPSASTLTKTNPNGTGTSDHSTPVSAPHASSAAQADHPASAQDPVGIDLSSLSAEDRRALQPIIDALASADLAGEGGDADVDVDEILKQMDAADKVADDLEGKLDGLLAKLERDAREMERDAAGGVDGASSQRSYEASERETSTDKRL